MNSYQLLLTLFSLLLSAVVNPYPVEHKPDPIQYQLLLKSRSSDTLCFATDDIDVYLIVAKQKGVKIVVRYATGKIQSFTELTTGIESCPDTAFAADLNNDGRLDMKIFFNFEGASPLASKVKMKMYLLSEPDGSYSKLSFFDFSMEPETDFNADHIYEIVTKELVQFRKHSYWKYELFQYSRKKLRNVSLKYGYPRLIPFRIKPTNKPLANLTEAERHKLISKLPREYDQQ